MFPIYPLEFFGLVVQLLLVTLSSAGGLGGGSLYLPIILLFF